MRIPTSIGYAVGTAAAIALLAGCSNGASSVAPGNGMIPPQSVSRTAARSEGPASWVPKSAQQAIGYHAPRPNWMVDPDVIVNDLFVSEFGSASPPSGLGFLFQYPANDKHDVKPRCTKTGNGINGIGMDAAGTLWVPESVTASTPAEVLSYLPGCKLQSRVLTNPSGQPSDIAFDSHNTAFVVDIFGASGSTTPGLIDVYPSGHNTPARQLTNANINEALGIAIDKLDNVYLAFTDGTGAPHIAKFAKGKGHGTLLNVTGLMFPIGLELDAAQNLIVTDAAAASELIYKPPYTGAPTSSFAAHGEPIEGKLNKLNTLLYVSDATGGSVDVYKYPSGAYQYSVTKGLDSTLNVEGVALDPENAN